MIRITVTLIPYGDESRAREVARADVANISDLAVMSDYRADVVEQPNPVTLMGKQRAVLELKEHRRDQSVWALVAGVAGMAARKFSLRPLPDRQDAIEISASHNQVLDMWAEGRPSRDIALVAGVSSHQVHGIVSRARARGDTRAVSRSSSGRVVR